MTADKLNALAVRVCENCRWFHATQRKGETYTFSTYRGEQQTSTYPITSGQCRAASPVFSQNNDRSDGWPYVGGEEWCGCFVPALTQEPPHA